MDKADFTNTAPGTVVWIREGEYGIREGTYSFLPSQLPNELDLPMKTMRLLEDARGALGELSGIGRMLPNPHLVIRPFLRREAISSNIIEGTVTTMEELSVYEARQSLELHQCGRLRTSQAKPDTDLPTAVQRTPPEADGGSPRRRTSSRRIPSRVGGNRRGRSSYPRRPLRPTTTNGDAGSD